jgi:hypothetical protein
MPILHWPCSLVRTIIYLVVRGVTYRSNDTRAVGSDQASLVLRLQDVGDAHHVYRVSSLVMQALLCLELSHTVLGDTLSDAIKLVRFQDQEEYRPDRENIPNDERDFCRNRLFNTGSSHGRTIYSKYRESLARIIKRTERR